MITKNERMTKIASNLTSVLFFSRPSLIRGLATPWTYFLHLSLSSVILIDYFIGSPVHVSMLSVQALRGLPCLRASGFVRCISLFRQLPCFLIVFPQCASFLALTMSNSSPFTPALSRTHSLVFFAVHENRRIFLALSPRASRYVSSLFLSVQLS